MDELHERMLEDLYTLIGFENAGREELCFSCGLPRKRRFGLPGNRN